MDRLFEAIQKFSRGRPHDLVEPIQKLRRWLTSQKDKRPSGYMNHPHFFSAYATYHLPLHLPELYWILEQHAALYRTPAPQSFLDLGCGPGTLSLSALLWLEHQKLSAPEVLHLVDFSTHALQGAQFFLESLQSPARISRHKIHLMNSVRWKPAWASDWVFLGHVLNEWGHGPRNRERKLAFIEQVFFKLVKPGGSLFIIEPPLREPTLDLMWLRDRCEELFEEHELRLVGPCPRGIQQCPLLKQRLGWCYAQPPRSWAQKQGLTPWDREIKQALETRLDQPGFSYLVLHRPGEKDLPEPLPHAIAVTDAQAPRPMACTRSGLKKISTPHRGAYLYKG